MSPDPGPVFHQFFTPSPGPKGKRRILLESTPAFRIRVYIWCRPFWCTKNWIMDFVLSITARSASALTIAFCHLLETLSCEPTVYPPLSWLL